ncbi:ZZ-type zinc finger-containing protein [Planoprotostelium fungivorum]|uniref:ZZ-type zinc finger-containing protein n=1 Tax=Planoprotostelium fungivorum TaxID=1890364 RepID=A0A2P6NNN3_9EUKA|nr:ZZ-type zinc finger-containing protein [Planoprotostelium fungivorum]
MDETETYTEANARDIHCSHCGEIIVGAKRRCENCSDYTLCSTCMERQEQADPTFHHSAYCDHCGTTILGIRYKCKECSNYDLCMTCIKLKDTVHPNHTYTAMDKTSYGCVSGDSTNLRMTARELNNLITSETAVAKLWKPPNNRLLVHFIVLDYG